MNYVYRRRLQRNSWQIYSVVSLDQFEAGLADAENEEEFFTALESLEQVWNDRETCSTGKPAQFYLWFRKTKSKEFITSVIKPVRIKGGLGDPPSAYTNNANEGWNREVKGMNNYKGQDWPDFVQHVRGAVESNYEEVKKAVIGIGEYKLSNGFESFAITIRKWNQLTKEQQQKHLEKVLSKNTDDLPNISNVVEDAEHEAPAPLSVNPYMCDINNMPKKTLEAIFHKASRLCNTVGSTQSTPGYNGKCKMVASSRKCPPHFIWGYTNGRYECDSNCPQWSSAKICSHTVAAAECNQELTKFVKWYEKNNKQLNMMALVTHMQEERSNAGRKGNSRNPKCRTNTKIAIKHTIKRVPIANSSTSTSHTSGTTASTRRSG